MRARDAAIFGGVAALLPLAWLGLLVASQQVDRERVAEHLAASFENGSLPIADYPPLPFAALHAGRRFSDAFSECWALGVSLHGTAEDALRSAATSPTIAPPDPGGLCEKLRAVLASGEWRRPDTAFSYFVYWHGHQLWSRPLLALFTAAGLHAANALLLAAAGAWLAIELARSLGGSRTVVVIVCLLAIGDVANTAVVTHHALAIAVAIAAAAAAARSLRVRAGGIEPLVAIALVAGSATAFVDLLVTPPLGPTLLAAVALASSLPPPERTTRAQLARKAACAALLACAWLGAYAATWIAKWLLAAVWLGAQPVLGEVRGRASFRLRGAAPGVSNEAFAATLANVDRIDAAPLALCVALALGLLALGCLRGRDRATRALGFAAFAALAALPVAWMEVLSSHSQIHAWFTFRSFAASCAALLLGGLWAAAEPVAPRDPPRCATRSAASSRRNE